MASVRSVLKTVRMVKKLQNVQSEPKKLCKSVQIVY